MWERGKSVRSGDLTEASNKFGGLKKVKSWLDGCWVGSSAKDKLAQGRLELWFQPRQMPVAPVEINKEAEGDWARKREEIWGDWVPSRLCQKGTVKSLRCGWFAAFFLSLACPLVRSFTVVCVSLSLMLLCAMHCTGTARTLCN